MRHGGKTEVNVGTLSSVTCPNQESPGLSTLQKSLGLVT